MVAANSKMSYEECRWKRLEENKKRMEALNLPQLAQSLHKSIASPTRSPRKQVKPRSIEKRTVAVRRSDRVANLPSPVYRVVLVYKFTIPRRICSRRNPSNVELASVEAREYAIEKAEEVVSTLEPQYPTVVKSMLPSHVSGGFWLGLPVHFCKKNLSKNDSAITLVDEEDEEFEAVYLARKTGLSGGWRGFSIDHELTDGDALVFQLIRPTTLKVYIARASGYDEA